MIRCLCGHDLARVVGSTDGDTNRTIVFHCIGKATKRLAA